MREVKNRNIKTRIKAKMPKPIGWLLCFVFLVAPFFAQAQVGLCLSKVQLQFTDDYKLPTTKQYTPFFFSLSTKKTNSHFKSVKTYQSSNLPAIEKYRELGIFCKLDLRLDKTMYMPFRFRLGNLEQVNKKEGYWR